MPPILRPLLLSAVVAVAVAADPSNFRTAIASLQPGDTLNLDAGTYAGDMNINGLHGRADAWITIQGPADGSAVFVADDSNNTVELANCSYLAIRQLTLDGGHRDGP